MKILRVLFDEKPENAYWNIALEETIPRAVGLNLSPPTLRFFHNKNAVIIGVFQYAEKEVNLEFTEKNNIQVVRRFTGGGAVYHDMGNLNYAISLPKNEFKTPTNMLEYYKFFIGIVVKALNNLGIKANLGKLNDIELNKKKIGGTAASIIWNVSFFHGTLLLNTNLNIMAKVLKVPKSKLSDKGVVRIEDRVMNIFDVYRSISEAKIIDSIITEFEKELNVRAIKGKLLPVEVNITNCLYKNKYSQDSWNLERESVIESNRRINKLLKEILRENKYE